VDGDSESISLPRTEIRWNETESFLSPGSLLPDLSETRILDNRFAIEEREVEGSWDPDEGYGGYYEGNYEAERNPEEEPAPEGE
jgi:hypothetical protein